MIDFACWIADVDPEDEHFVAAVGFFLAYPANLSVRRQILLVKVAGSRPCARPSIKFYPAEFLADP